MDPTRTAQEHFQAGRYAEAEKLSREILRTQPRLVHAKMLLALSLNARGAHPEAVELLRQLTGMEPSRAVHWANLGTALRSAGEFDQAIEAYHEAARLGEASPHFLLNVGLLHLDRLEYGKARAVLKQAAALAPQDAEIRYFHAASLFGEVNNEQAEAALKDWRSFQGLTADMLTRVGTLLMQLGDTSGAEAAFREALKRDPAYALAAVRLAQLLERNNQVQEALQQLQIVSDSPGSSTELLEDLLATEARLAERGGDQQTAIAKYLRLLEMTPQPHQRYHVLFPLARAHDALGDYGQAAEVLGQAHESQAIFLSKAAPRFLEPGQQTFGITRFSSDPADIARWDDADAPDARQSPIFIVAFPRSGTTLLEQMLDAHPLLCSMDEQPFLQNAIDHIRSLGVIYPERLADLGVGQLRDVRSRYWERVKSKVSLQPHQRLVDKNPLNLLRLPAIRRLFPNARIILAIRHPCDVLISNYSQHYRAPEIALMCRTLESLADGYRRAFDFWYQQSGLLLPAVLELRYEHFVSDFEANARGIAEFLQLPWDNAMLEPAAHALKRGYISTPSYSQVVQPVNARAVGRWRNYEKYLRTVMPMLEPYFQRWGYDT